MRFHPRILCATLCASLSLPALLLSGCSDDGTITENSVTLASGNWQISSSAAAAARLPALSGELTSAAGKITGMLHSQSASACIAPSTGFAVSGSANDNNVISLAGPVSGGTLTITGTLAADGKSLTDAVYTVSSGPCAFAQPAAAIAQAFAPISGTYAGNFTDADGQVATVTAVLTQSPSADTSGNYTLTGTATVSNNACFPTTVPVSATTVTGGTFTFTYATASNSVTSTGTFAPDASALSVSSWVSSGNCGADSGTGSMPRTS